MSPETTSSVWPLAVKIGRGTGPRELQLGNTSRCSKNWRYENEVREQTNGSCSSQGHRIRYNYNAFCMSIDKKLLNSKQDNISESTSWNHSRQCREFEKSRSRFGLKTLKGMSETGYIGGWNGERRDFRGTNSRKKILRFKQRDRIMCLPQWTNTGWK